MNSEIFQWVILPLLIFMARILDVSLGTIRIVFVSRGIKSLAPLIGFVEVLIWLLAINQVMGNLTNVVCYLAYAGGFATGTFVGMYVEEKLAVGVRLVRVITHKDASDLLAALRAENYGITSVDAQGATGPVKVIYTVVRRGDLPDILSIVEKFNPSAFYSIEDVRFASEGVFPHRAVRRRGGLLRPLGYLRKGK